MKVFQHVRHRFLHAVTQTLLRSAPLCVSASCLAQTTTLPDLDQGRLWFSPVAVLTTGLHAAYVLNEPWGVANLSGARVEINLIDRKARAYAMWRVDTSRPGNEKSYREVGVGLANLGAWGSNISGLGAGVAGPSAYLAWGNTRRTLQWQRNRGTGTMPMSVLWGIRGEWLSRRVPVTNPSGSSEQWQVGLYLPLFLRIQLPVG
ncbi:MAG: hypothetical protein O3B70_08270 [Bacteroidetes bacterium]|nr:hypothetical protein [Bacteroidota bacterium]MDA0904318.1 hypothetical protein [Bacteroidota bacterium]MDA1242819.1 hypothetical protein [Bacteroidota bacterium]